MTTATDDRWLPISEIYDFPDPSQVTLCNISDITNGRIIPIVTYRDRNSREFLGLHYPCRSLTQLFYAESRDFLLSHGLVPLTDDAREGRDCCKFRYLFWDTNLYKSFCITTGCCTCSFQGTLTPSLLMSTPLDDNRVEVTLLSSSTPGNMFFRGSALHGKRPNNLSFVRKMYAGTMTHADLHNFLTGIPAKTMDELDFDEDPTPVP